MREVRRALPEGEREGGRRKQEKRGTEREVEKESCDEKKIADRGGGSVITANGREESRPKRKVKMDQ
jgi:hypothetical protein